MEHIVHFFTGTGEGERAVLLFFVEHGKACWCAACAVWNRLKP